MSDRRTDAPDSRRQSQSLRAIGLLLFALTAAPSAAEKTDRILVSNGNEILGEIKFLERGRLRVSTDFMGIVRMDWEQIARVESLLRFEVRTRDGQRYFGQLAPSDEDRVLVITGEHGSLPLPFHEVLLIDQPKPGRLGQLDASISLAFGFTQASEVTQVTFDGSVDRRTRRFFERAQLVTILNDTKDETFSREDLSYTITRHIASRWNYDASATLQANEELGLERRSLIRAGALHRFLRTDMRELSLGAGLAASREEYTGRVPGETNLEGTLSLRYFAFHFDDPALEVDFNLTVFPSLSTSGRVRVELQGDLKRELFRDLFWGFSVYESYDSDPVGEDARRNDLAVTTSLGWKL